MADFTVHSSLQARSDAQAVPNRGMSVPVRIALLEFDGDANDNQVLNRYHTLVHEDDTGGTGIVIKSIWGIITEAVVQNAVKAAVTLRTKGTTPVNVAVTTFNDNQPVGEQNATDSLTVAWDNRVDSTAYTTYHVPAGYGLEAALTVAGYEVAAGDGTGKMLLCVEYFVIPRTVTENL